MTNDINHIQNGIDAERAELEQKLSALNDKVSVESLTAEAGQLLREASSDIVQNMLARFGQNAQAHPLAVAAVGAGVSWLLSGAGAGSSESEPTVRRSMGAYNGPKPADGDPDRDTPVMVATHSTKRSPDLAERVQDQGREVIRTAQDQLTELRQQAEDMRDRIAEGTEDLSAEARARVIAAREKALAAAQTSGRKIREAGQVSADFAKDNPLVVGGVALALGAAVAGALYMRHSAGSGDDDGGEDRDAFLEADRVFEEELARARTLRNTAVQGIPDS